MAVKQTAGRDALGEFAPKFAELNDDVLFGQVWSREDKLSLRDRSIVTVVALMAQGLTDSAALSRSSAVVSRDRARGATAAGHLNAAGSLLNAGTSYYRASNGVR